MFWILVLHDFILNWKILHYCYKIIFRGQTQTQHVCRNCVLCSTRACLSDTACSLWTWWISVVCYIFVLQFVNSTNFLKVLTGDSKGMRGIGSGRVIRRFEFACLLLLLWHCDGYFQLMYSSCFVEGKYFENYSVRQGTEQIDWVMYLGSVGLNHDQIADCPG